MARVVTHTRVGTSASSSMTTGGAHRARPKRGLLVPILLQIGAMIALGAMLYPTAANWWATLNHNSVVSGYASEVQAMPDQQRAEALEAAQRYNENLPVGVLRDPYLESYRTDTSDGPAGVDAAYQAYLEILNIANDNAAKTGIMGQLTYPNVGIGLPIYHGTSAEVLEKGVGHLYGSSLPVGGPSTHAVLTGHSGLLSASLFTSLHKAAVGDTFQITVLGQTHYYQVDSIQVVLPNRTDSLQIVPDKDYVTLLTCTPTGVNSHRLLVRGVRVDAPTSTNQQIIAGDGITAGFPWWLIGFIAGSGTVAYMVFSPPRRRSKNLVLVD